MARGAEAAAAQSGATDPVAPEMTDGDATAGTSSGATGPVGDDDVLMRADDGPGDPPGRPGTPEEGDAFAD